MNDKRRPNPIEHRIETLLNTDPKIAGEYTQATVEALAGLLGPKKPPKGKIK